MGLNLNRQNEPDTHTAATQARKLLGAVIGLLALWLYATRFAPEARTQTNQSAEISANRFLFVFDTSAGMRRYQPGAFKVIEEMIGSDGNGQLRAGDTLGVWTFNQDVYADFPLQTWGREPREVVAGRLEAFLRKQPYTGASQLEKIVPGMMEVARHSDFITVIIVSDGESKMKGTPFDKEINKYYHQYVKDSKGGTVVVTIMQAMHGKLGRYAVTAPPWPVVIPEVPLSTNVPPKIPEKIAAIANTPPPAVAAPKHFAPPLIVPKPEPQPVVKPEVVVTSAEPPPAPSFAPPGPPPNFIPEQPPLEIVRTGPTPAPVVQQLRVPMVLPGNTKPPPTVSKPAASPDQTPFTETAKAIIPRDNSSTNRVIAFVSSDTTGRPKILLIAGITLAVIGMALIGLMVRRERRPAGPSYITRSMGNRKD